MTLSIVTCVYNGDRFIDYYWEGMSKIIDLVDNIIIINDGSTDDTYNQLQKLDTDKLKLINKTNTGLPASRNIGLEMVKTDYVIFLDIDDQLCRTTLEKLIKKVKNSFYDIVYGNVSYVNEKGYSTKMMYIWSLLKSFKFISFRDTKNRIFMNNFLVTPGSLMFRTGYVINYKFNENLTIGEDWEFFTRVFKNAKVASVKSTLIKYMIVSTSMSLTTMNNSKKLELLTNELIKNFKRSFPESNIIKYENHLYVTNELFKLQRSGYKMSFLKTLSIYFKYIKISPKSKKYILNSFIKMILAKVF